MSNRGAVYSFTRGRHTANCAWGDGAMVFMTVVCAPMRRRFVPTQNDDRQWHNIAAESACTQSSSRVNSLQMQPRRTPRRCDVIPMVNIYVFARTEITYADKHASHTRACTNSKQSGAQRSVRPPHTRKKHTHAAKHTCARACASIIY